MTKAEMMIGLPGYQITGMERVCGKVRIRARYTGAVECPHCGGNRLRSKGRYVRSVRHEDWRARATFLDIETQKWLCRDCNRQHRQRLPGILPCQRAR